MALTFSSNKSLEEIKNLIDDNFSVNSTLKKDRIIVRKKELMVLVKKNKNTYKIYSDINFKNHLIIILLIISIIFPILVFILIFIVLYSLKHKKLKRIRQEIYNIAVV